MSRAETLKAAGITGAWVEPNLGYANAPELHVRADSLPDADFFPYRSFKVGDGTLWWAHDPGGWVRYLMENPANDTGYGGATFTLATADGPKVLKGPWSSRAGVANTVAPIHCIEVYVHPDDRPGTFHGLNLSIARANLALMEHSPNWTLGSDGRVGETRWELRWRPAGDRRPLYETHGEFLEWKALMGTMAYLPGRWFA